MALELSILTLNVWGIPFVSRDREIRINEIGKELSSGKYDIVSLQEVWSEYDLQRLKTATASVFPFAHYFYSGVVGSGLCVFSKFPIISALYHAWSVNGYVHRIQHGDWFGGKGVGLCKINVNGNLIHFYTAHLHAEYNRVSDDYMAHRVIQAFDTAQFIENTRGSSMLQILAGDLNTEPGDLAYRVLLSTSKLNDAYKLSGSELAGTNEATKNSYTDASVVKSLPKGKRIDYIMFRPGFKFRTEVKIYNHPLPDRVPGYSFSFSDHEAVFSRIITKKMSPDEFRDKILQIGDPNSFTTDTTVERDTYTEMHENMNALKESIKICNESLDQLDHHKKSYILMAVGAITVLFFLIDVSPPYGLKSLYLMLKIMLSGLVLFFIFMATIWNIMEKHGILSGKLSMEIALKSLEQIVYNNENFKSI